MNPLNAANVHVPAKLGDSALRAKFNRKTNTYEIYNSKGKGPGFKEKSIRLFGMMDKKKETLRRAVQALAEKNPALKDLCDNFPNAPESKLLVQARKGEDLNQGDLEKIVRTTARLEHIERLAALEVRLPKGIDVKPDGVVKGSHDIAGAKEIIEDVVSTAMNGAMKNVNGQSIFSPSVEDMHRMDFRIGTDVSTQGGQDGAERLIKFAETPEAAKLLSCVMHQGTLLRLLKDTGTWTGSGQFIAAAPKQTLKDLGKNNYQVRHVAADGTESIVDNPSQMGDATVKLSKSDKFYEIQVDWPWYATTFGNGNERAILDDNSLMMNMSFTILIDKEKANQGELAFEFKRAPAVTASGRIDVDRVKVQP